MSLPLGQSCSSTKEGTTSPSGEEGIGGGSGNTGKSMDCDGMSWPVSSVVATGGNSSSDNHSRSHDGTKSVPVLASSIGSISRSLPVSKIFNHDRALIFISSFMPSVSPFGTVVK
jgi:hypothetical protein